MIGRRDAACIIVVNSDHPDGPARPPSPSQNAAYPNNMDVAVPRRPHHDV